jgi:hypothetical protein
MQSSRYAAFSDSQASTSTSASDTESKQVSAHVGSTKLDISAALSPGTLYIKMRACTQSCTATLWLSGWRGCVCRACWLLALSWAEVKAVCYLTYLTDHELESLRWKELLGY